MAKRIGILGGTFDPIHLGHLAIAQYSLEKLQLDEVRFIPCQQNALKDQAMILPWQRAAMVALAIVNHPKFLLDTRELERDTPSYSYLTLASLYEEFPAARLFWLMGDDLFSQVEQWYCWQEMAKFCDLVVVSRMENYQPNPVIEEVFMKAQKQVIHLEMPVVEASSRVLRKNLPACLDRLPPRVRKFVLENGLYS